jgi:hypothetical protein
MIRVIKLGKITEDTMRGWESQFDIREDRFYCKKCGAMIMSAPCFISLHLKVFDPVCTGPGKVFNTVYPYCTACDGEIDHVKGCIHLDIDLEELFNKYSIFGIIPAVR